MKTIITMNLKTIKNTKIDYSLDLIYMDKIKQFHEIILIFVM